MLRAKARQQWGPSRLEGSGAKCLRSHPHAQGSHQNNKMKLGCLSLCNRASDNPGFILLCRGACCTRARVRAHAWLANHRLQSMNKHGACPPLPSRARHSDQQQQQQRLQQQLARFVFTIATLRDSATTLAHPRKSLRRAAHRVQAASPKEEFRPACPGKRGRARWPAS